MECGNQDRDIDDPEPNQNNKSGGSKSKGPTIAQRDRSQYKIFCEGHRPFKLITEIKEKNESNNEDLIKFCKSMKKAVDVMARIPYRCKSVVHRKWKEKDKRTLLDRVRERFILVRKLRINVIRVDPAKKRKRKNNVTTVLKPKSKRQKITDYAEVRVTNERASVDNESSIMSSKADEQKEVYYKVANPCFPAEPDWSITLSRNDFPWYDIKFDDYTAQECFDMYRSLITDEDTFNRKIRKEKNATINKLLKENKQIIKKAKQKGFNVQQLSKKQLKKQVEQQ